MSEVPLSREQLLANPTICADGARYSSVEGGAEAQRNRTVTELMHFLPFETIRGDELEVRGHDPSSNGAAADFYDNSASGIPAAPDSQSQSQAIKLKMIATRWDMRQFDRFTLGEFYPEKQFQKRALAHAIHKEWEETAIEGNSTVNPTNFDGLNGLVSRGLGKTFDATAVGGTTLTTIDRMFTNVNSHNGRIDLMVMNRRSWRRMLDLIRNEGYFPDFAHCPQLGRRTLHYNGVPVCLSDFVPTTGDPDNEVSTIYFLTLGKLNGVFTIVPEATPTIVWDETLEERNAFRTVHGYLMSALVSPTDDALVQLFNWSVL